MNHSEFKNLVVKYLNGTATFTERERLLEYYERMQINTDWREELMGNKQQARARIFGKINDEIEDKESRVTFGIWKIAVAVAIIISTGVLGLRYFKGGSNANHAVACQTMSATNHIIRVKLADGTKVWLNSGSKLTYPQRFTGHTREVVLNGEAYFDVTHQSKPFVIRSGKMVTQVLGTSFNVRAYAGSEVQKVSVVSGKVGVIVPGAAKKQVVFLTRNQEIAFNKQSNVVNKRTITDARVAISWISNKIKFRNTPLPEAMQELERIYHVRVTYADGLKTCPVFADFNRTDNVSKVLEMLAKSLGGKLVQKDQQTFYITGRPC